MNKTLNSKSILIGIFAIYLVSFLGFGMWKEGAKGGDPLGYYLYLPSVLIHQDILDLENTREALNSRFEDELPLTYFNDTDIVFESEKGQDVIKYTSGMSIMIFPFFMLAHLLSLLLGIPANGFTTIYVFCHYFSGLFYACLGLWLLRNILLKWFSDRLVAMGLIIIGLGTNLYFFSVYHPVMAHATLFLLHVLTIYATIHFYERPGWIMASVLGLSIGLITLIRPSEIIVILIPFFWGIQHFRVSDLQSRFRFYRKHLGLSFLGFGIAGVLILPQLIYWRLTSGEWLFYSYGNEGFDFIHPHIIDGLFSFKNGWLAYTPIMIFAVIGLFLMHKSNPARWPIWTFIPLHIYIIYSWWCWFYINGFGSRPMVEAYALLAIPLLFTWQRITPHRWIYYSALVISTLFVFQNLFNTWQYKQGLMWSEYATREYYFSMIGKTAINQEDLILYDCGEYQSSMNQYIVYDTLFKKGFDEINGDRIVERADSYGKMLRLEKSQDRFIVLNTSTYDVGLKKGDYIQINFQAKKEDGMARIYESAVAAIRFETVEGRGLKTRRIRLNNKIANPENNLWGGWKGGIWDTITFRCRAPKLLESSRLVIYFENLYEDLIFIDHLKVTLWKEAED